MGEASMSDEELRKLLKPNPSNEEIIQLVQQKFAPSSDCASVEIIKELDSYDDRNYWMKIAGEEFLVKVHNGVESKDACAAMEHDQQDSVIHFQYAIMKALGDNGIAASCPIFPKDQIGNNNDNQKKMLAVDLPVVSASHSPCTLIVSVYTWVPGTTMASLQVLPIECLADAGRFLGQVHHQLGKELSSKDLPAAKRYHQWDGKNTSDLKGFLHCIENDVRRTMIQSILDAFDKDLIQSGVADKLRKGVNHGDFNDANILMNDKFKVTGVIDFGDSIESWTVLDVSVAMAYSMLTAYGKSGRSVSAAAAVLRGFHSVYPLTKEEREHLVLLISCRLACSVTLGAYSYQQNPENKYLLLHAEPAWEALEFIWGGNDALRRAEVGKAMNRVFDAACQGNTKDTGDDGVIDCGDLTLCDRYILELQDSVVLSAGPAAKRQKLSGDKVITFVTGNKKKLEEVQRILFEDATVDYSLTNAKIDLPELQGDPIAIAKGKCEAAAKIVGGAVITEDTSLCFMALNELPGPYIKWFLDGCGHAGLNKMLDGFDDRTAYAQTVVAYCEGPGREVVTFDGRTMGKVVAARGKLDFGWDPIFEPSEGGGKTYAEMEKGEKDAISHRSRAFAKLKVFLTN